MRGFRYELMDKGNDGKKDGQNSELEVKNSTPSDPFGFRPSSFETQVFSGM